MKVPLINVVPSLEYLPTSAEKLNIYRMRALVSRVCVWRRNYMIVVCLAEAHNYCLDRNSETSSTATNIFVIHAPLKYI